MEIFKGLYFLLTHFNACYSFKIPGWHLRRSVLSAMGVGRGAGGPCPHQILNFDIFLLSFLKNVVFAVSSGYNGIIPFCSRGQIILATLLKILPTPMPSGSLTPTDSKLFRFWRLRNFWKIAIVHQDHTRDSLLVYSLQPHEMTSPKLSLQKNAFAAFSFWCSDKGEISRLRRGM